MTAYSKIREDGPEALFAGSHTERLVSLVIPAHNEERRLYGTLVTYGEKMREQFGEDYEVVVVVNGCSDGTAGVAKAAAVENPRVRVVEIEEAVGKGGAVLEGMRRAEGGVVAFADADGATAPESLVMLFEELDRSDVAIGSRRMTESKITQPQTPTRRLLGFVFARTAGFLFGMPFKDTQCGAKAMRAEAARRLCEVVSETRWTFDLDLLLCARRLGLEISEHPVVWEDKKGSCLRTTSTAWEVLQAFWTMKRRQQLPLAVLPEPPVLGEEEERAPDADEKTPIARGVA